MPDQEMPTPFRVVEEWETKDKVYREHIEALWPELAKALYRLADSQASVITDPGSVIVPTMADPGRAGGSRSRSAARSEVSRPGSTRDAMIPGQIALFEQIKDGEVE